MNAVLKIGGSLLKEFRCLRELMKSLAGEAEREKITVVPGGGPFADLVRELYREHGLSEETSHKMAVLSMDIYGLLLADLSRNTKVVETIKGVKKAVEDKTLPVLLPSKLVFALDPFQPSWSVTSDSLAAYICWLIGCKRLILVKDIDGVYTSNPKKNKDAMLIPRINLETLRKLKEKCVDDFLAIFLMRSKIKCYVVNGFFPSRVKNILKGKEDVYTEIIS